MQSHRDWLLGLHGAVCAYCGTETSEEAITLDHVRPRRGQAFLMQRRARGVYLLHYGEHLSEPLRELAKQASERPLADKE
jgi:hypothetical protein